MDLQRQISDSEDKIAIYRESFNNYVLVYNNSCEQFPSNLVAQLFGFKTANFIEIPEDEIKDIQALNTYMAGRETYRRA